MKKIVVAAIFSLIAGSTSLLFPQAAKADRVVYCHPVTDNRVVKESAADHSHAYANGYREGEQSARNREAYKPRTGGGEFARGFQDGYLNLPYAGQENVVSKTIVQQTTQVCNEDGYYTVAPPPVYIYNPYAIYGSPYPTFGINFGFGRGGYRWGHYRRW
ncbi:hypothetical protein [Nostoc sp.]|uniref:hypothetical protein n=1 Tax=Nostoc sp. TaxID=1180 RepID=UPI002FFD32A3